jgi:hypothetical protein
MQELVPLKKVSHYLADHANYHVAALSQADGILQAKE